MKIQLTHEEVRRSHPDLMRQLIAKLRASGNRDADKPEGECEFYYSYGQSVQAQRMDQLFQRPKAEPTSSKEQKINDLLKTVIGLSLTIESGRTRRYIQFDTPPQLFIDKFVAQYSKHIEDSLNEEQRLSKLTPEERSREQQELINDLMDDGGFMGLNVGPNGITPITSKPIEYDLNSILDKIGRVGVAGLTDGERKFLEEQSK